MKRRNKKIKVFVMFVCLSLPTCPLLVLEIHSLCVPSVMKSVTDTSKWHEVKK